MTQDFEDNLKIDTMHNFFPCQITKIFYDFFTFPDLDFDALCIKMFHLKKSD